MGYALTKTIEFADLTCGGCGIIFYVPQDWKDQKWEKKNDIWCPNGCARFTIPGKDTDAAKLESAKRELEWERRKNEQLKNSERSLKGQIAKFKKRTGNGVCPCCKRTFKQLARHMKCKHPNYAVKEPKP